jgi:hypothetical protein
MPKQLRWRNRLPESAEVTAFLHRLLNLADTALRIGAMAKVNFSSLTAIRHGEETASINRFLNLTDVALHSAA